MSTSLAPPLSHNFISSRSLARESIEALVDERADLVELRVRRARGLRRAARERCLALEGLERIDVRALSEAEQLPQLSADGRACRAKRELSTFDPLCARPRGARVIESPYDAPVFVHERARRRE